MSKIVLSFVVGLGLGASLVFIEPVSLWSTTSTVAPVSDADAMAIHDEVVSYGAWSGYLVRPLGNEKRPAIILIHEWWGLNDDIRELARQFAQSGYVVLAVDLYDGESTMDPTRARELAAAIRTNPESAFDQLEATVAYLRELQYVDETKLASVGWCFGGTWSYQMAVNDLGTRASVMYYGQFDLEDDFTHMRTHILGHFGEEDSNITIDTVREFQAALQTTHGPHEVYIYPHVGHGFANARGGNNLEYDAEAAHLAWSRTLEFLAHTFEE